MEPCKPTAVSDAILAELKRIARDEIQLPPGQVDEIGPETPLIDGLQLDSLTQVVLLSEVEARYGLVPGVDDLDALQRVETVADLIRFIEQRASSLDPLTPRSLDPGS